MQATHTVHLMAVFFSDKLGSTVFAPVKMDFTGNIKVGHNVVPFTGLLSI